MSYLTEAFKALDALNEDTFDVSTDGIKKLAEFEDSDDLIDEVTVFDDEAETEEDLQDSYVGKVIVDCNVCHSKIYKDKEDIRIDDETQNANIDEECPYCYSNEGFKVVGEVVPVTNDTEVTAEKPVDKTVIEETGEVKLDDTLSECLEETAGIDETNEKESIEEATVTDYKGSLSNVLVKHQDELSKLTSKMEIMDFLKKITPEVRDQNYLETVIRNMQKKNDFGAVQYLYGIILSGEGKGVTNEACGKKLKEDLGEDVDKYQEWVDYDMKRYGTISAQTNKEIKEAGLQIVKDKYGDFEVIAGNAKIDESIESATIEDIEDFIADVKDRFPGSEAIYDGDTNTVKITLDTKKESLREDWSFGVILYFDMPLDEVEKAIADGKLRIPAYEHGEWSDTHSLRVQGRDFAGGYGSIDRDKDTFQFVYPTYDNEIRYVFNGGKTILNRAIKTQDISAMKDAGLNREVRAIKDAFAEAGVNVSNVKVTLRSPSGEFTTALNESLKESIDNVNVTTDTDIVNITSEENGKVTVSTEPVEHKEETEEVIAPISDETEKDIEDIDIDEFDEESFDELGESYLKEVYDNVDSYKTSKVEIKDNKFMVEGLLKFTNGKEKKLSFMFESNKRSKDGKLNILGESLNIAKGQKAFSVIGKADGKKFISESLNYNYRVKNTNGKSTRCEGTVKRG